MEAQNQLTSLAGFSRQSRELMTQLDSGNPQNLNDVHLKLTFLSALNFKCYYPLKFLNGI